MDVIVYWSKEGVGAGAIDSYTSPYERDPAWSMWRVEFWEDVPGSWCVRAVGPDTSIKQRTRRGLVAVGELKEDEISEEERKAEWVPIPGLKAKAKDLGGFEAWLEENVDAIQVNGYPWWQSERLTDEAGMVDAFMDGAAPTRLEVRGKHAR